MDITEAAQIVLDRLSECPMFIGKYDARRRNEKSKHYMYGIATVMENIALLVSDECLDEFADRFWDNMVESERRADE